MTIRVLLVEDDRRVHDVVAKLLESIGDLKPVSTITTEAEANLWLQENPEGWDLAVIDLILEAGTGMGVLAKCRSWSRAGKAVVLSNYLSPAIARNTASRSARWRCSTRPTTWTASSSSVRPWLSSERSRTGTALPGLAALVDL